MEIQKCPNMTELPCPDNTPCPYEASYTTDVVVVGCGFAGLNAAVAARKAGCSVLVVDKGKPGYSGLSPWVSSFRWFDPERGDRAEAYRRAIQEGGDYISNLNWYERWIEESKDVYHRLTEWGILTQYPKGADAGDYFANEDFVGYREHFDRFDRRKKFTAVLKQHDIPWLQHTMVTDAVMEQDRLAGVIGFHVPSGQVIRIRAKAVVLATGGGCYKPTGYPVGGDTFDGEYIAYQLGLPIAGKEFDDFHKTSSAAPGNVFLDNHWQYLENIWLCGGDVTADDAVNYAASKGNTMVMGRVRDSVSGIAPADGSEIQDVRFANYTRRGGSVAYGSDPEEVRSGKMSTPTAASSLPGGAVGMCCHLSSGVFCGLDELDCASGVDGLFVCGDGTHATVPSGAAYPCGVGFTSCFCSIDGDHAGRSAAEYACRVRLSDVSEDTWLDKTRQLCAPLALEKGFDPNWARDVLHSIMAPYWISVAKTEDTLRAALVQVLYMKDHVIPKLCAHSGHDLRLCIEMQHKVLSAEMKLRAGIERRESRGTHYRSDVPYRDDENFLCYITLRKGEGGDMVIDRVPLPDEWTGDKARPYDKRYLFYFPGEAQAKGFTPPQPKFFGKGKR